MEILAYIDGTTGGMMLQVLLGSAVGGLVILKMAARRFTSLIFRGKKPTEQDDDGSQEPEAPRG